ncbi:1-phosphatidylinositol 4-kinase [Malassezia sp. CBS 17886]|nr:1-phosphatidylinositol 4-kinase [Malassezia sp. CBS 17886]
MVGDVPVVPAASPSHAPAVLPPGPAPSVSLRRALEFRPAPRAPASRGVPETWGTPGRLDAGSASADTIDLTAENDEDDEPILVGARTSRADPDGALRRNAYVSPARPLSQLPAPPSAWVCIGVVYPSVLCMYGLPPELQRPHASAPLPQVDDAWEHLSFWGEPGYRPVVIQPSSSTTPSGGPLRGMPSLRGQARGLAVCTLAPPCPDADDGAASPRPLNEYGTLVDKFNRVLEPLFAQRRIICVSRSKLYAPERARAFQQSIETLLFTMDMHAPALAAALARADIFLDTPVAYTPSDFPQSPRLLDVASLQPQSGSRARLVPVPVNTEVRAPLGAAAVSKDTQEEEQKAQISAVYATLCGSDDLQETEPGPLLSSTLFPHQKQALTFLLDRERARSFDELPAEGADGYAPARHISLWHVSGGAATARRYRNVVTQTNTRKRPSICRGAILADDMGLGKTITVIAMIARTTGEAHAFGAAPLAADADDDDEPQLVGDSRTRRTAEQALREELRCRSRGTLLVCPLSIVSNWEAQIREHWAGGKQPSIYVYHGNGRLADPRVLADHDVVITTYSTLGFEFSNQSTWVAAAGRTDQDVEAGRASGSETDAADVDAGGAPGAPPGAKGRAKRRKRLLESANTCQRVEWFRVVLDEAHIVKESKTWQSKAVCNLSAPRRICLTGTPIQNKLDDLYALVLFLRLEPFTDRAVWNRFCGDRKHLFLGQARGKESDVLDPTSLARVQTIMKFLTLRRMKSDRRANGEPILSLPDRSTRVLTLAMDVMERTKYQALHSRFSESFEGHVAHGTVGANYATILHEILILRMMCDHAELVDDSRDAGRTRFEMPDLAAAIRDDGLTRRRAVEFFALLSESLMASCQVCGAELVGPCAEDAEDAEMRRGAGADAPRAPVVTRCQHTFCSSCFGAHAGTQWPRPTGDARAACPCCATELHLVLDAVLLTAADLDQSGSASAGSSMSSAPARLSEWAEGALFTPVTDDTKPRVPPFDPCDPESWPSTWSTKIRALMLDLLPFARCNPYSGLYDPQAPVLDHVVVEKARAQGRDGGSPARGGEAELPARKLDMGSPRTSASSPPEHTPPADMAALPRALSAHKHDPNTSSSPSPSPTSPPPFRVVQTCATRARNVPPVKSVVFSQWTRMLDKIGQALAHAGIQFRQLDGSMSRHQRQESLDAFKNNPAVEVFLVSLRAGGFGLNLVSACRAYLMDPYWYALDAVPLTHRNPAVESQGLDRIYRLGQTRPVVMTKFIMSHSIEEQMLELQRRKLELANRVGSRRLVDDAKAQRNDELKLLFS